MGFSTYNNVRNNSRVTGGVFPVNPAYPTVFGDTAYVRVSDIPGDPMDIVIVLVAAEFVPQVVQDCAAAGVGNAVLLTLGFAQTRSAGIALQAETVALTGTIAHENLDQACVLSFSGGTASLGADLVGAADLTLAKFTPETAAGLADRAPAFGFAGNPIDLTTFAAVFSSARQIDEIEINPLRVVGTGSGTEFVVLDVVALIRRWHG
jgi:acyl-CoA synthetase (NDP forming)